MDLPSAERLIEPSLIRHLSGFGLWSGADGYVVHPKSIEEVHEAFALARRVGRKVTLRGNGRSYGDAAVGRENVVIDITSMNRICDWDPQSGVVDAQGGVTIEQVWRTYLPKGFWLPVVSGTMFPTLAGALAMNIHGKNNFRAGTLGEHVQELEVVTPGGEVLTLKAEDELFRAIVSGAGLFGVITRVKLKLKPVQSGNLRVFAYSCENWDEQFEIFGKQEGTADYMVSWIDCFGHGKNAGRGLFHAAWHDPEDAPDSLSIEYQDLPSRIMGLVPKSEVWRILALLNNRPGMRFLNWAKHVSGRLTATDKIHKQSLVAFSFLLDYVPNWRNAYLPDGFIQYQSFVPKEHAPRVFAEQVRMQQEAQLESYLGVLKCHRPDDFLISHAVDGYSLALDFKVVRKDWPKLQALCHRMNDLVLEAGGRFYLAKDSTLRPEDFRAYMGESAVHKIAELRDRMDPERLLESELSKRLQL